jgi:hypothetical protein
MLLLYIISYYLFYTICSFFVNCVFFLPWCALSIAVLYIKNKEIN